MVVWEEFAGVANDFPFRLLLTTITKHVRSLSAVWQMLLLSTAITTAVLFSLRISSRITKEHGNLVRPHHSIIFLSLRKLSSSRAFSSVLFKNGTICFYKRLHTSSAYIYLIFKQFQIWLDFHRKCDYPKVLVVHQVYFFFLWKTKNASAAFFVPFSSYSLAVQAKTWAYTPGTRFPNLKSRSFSGPSQISKIKSEQWKRGPSWKKKQNKTKETKNKKAVHFVW